MSSPSKTDETPKECSCKPGLLMKKLGIWPLPKSASLVQIATLGGKASYVLLSVNLFNPDLIAKIHPNTNLTTNVFLGGAILGGTVCLFNSPHLALTAPQNCHNRLTFSFYTAAMNTFGSVLLWAMIRAFIPDKPLLRTALAISTSVTMMKLGSRYVDHVDNLAIKVAE